MSPNLVFRPRFDDPRIVAQAPDWEPYARLLGPERVAVAREALEGLIGAWAQIFGLTPAQLDRSADLEDWVENAIMLTTAASLGIPFEIVARSVETPRLSIPEDAASDNLSKPDHQA